MSVAQTHLTRKDRRRRPKQRPPTTPVTQRPHHFASLGPRPPRLHGGGSATASGPAPHGRQSGRGRGHHPRGVGVGRLVRVGHGDGHGLQRPLGLGRSQKKEEAKRGLRVAPVALLGQPRGLRAADVRLQPRPRAHVPARRDGLQGLPGGLKGQPHSAGGHRGSAGVPRGQHVRGSRLQHEAACLNGRPLSALWRPRGGPRAPGLPREGEGQSVL